MDRRTFVAGIGTFLIGPKAFSTEGVKTTSEMLAAVANKHMVMATGGKISWPALYQLMWSFSEIKQESGEDWAGKNTSNKTFMYNTKMAEQVANVFNGFNVKIETEELQKGFTLNFSQKRTTQETSYPDDDLKNPKNRFLHLEDACVMTFVPTDGLPDDVLLIRDEASGEYGMVQAVIDPELEAIMKKHSPK